MNQTSTRPSYKTAYPRTEDTTWYIVDAQDQVLGRLASQIARVLQGKHEADYSPQWDGGHRVVVINAEKVKLTGRKLQQKKYYRHTGWVGGLKERTAEEWMERDPTFLIQKAVKGMLPKTNLGRVLAKNVKVYAGEEHPHAAQKPQKLEF